jgi:dihydromonapterin reductase/dihydrofolate reductase
MPSPVFISGVGKRLGFALAKDLLANGFEVVGTYRTMRPEVEELFDLGATLYACDFYQQDGVNHLIESIQAKHESLRALIHNASDWLPENTDFSPADTFTRMMQVHAGVPYQLNLALKPLLFAGDDTQRDIIHITDYVADTGSKKHIAYAASKAALQNMTLSFSALLAPEVKVNAIAPALILFNDHDSDAYKAKAVDKALLPKEGGLEEFLSSVWYLLGSSYITGRTLHLDGGRHLK